MAKPAIADEVQVLHFFETSSVETAQVVFNIVADRMRERLHAHAPEREGHNGSVSSPKRRQSASTRTAPGDPKKEDQPIS